MDVCREAGRTDKLDRVERFGRYRVTGSLGAGAMGEVFAAFDESLGREVAVKTLRAGRTGLAARMLDERFRLEARAIASLSHPSVVQVFDLDLHADPPYLVMERVAGPSLREKLRAGALSETDLRALGIQIGRALAAAHASGVVHRDVKPANILSAGDGVWKLADFGVAHVPDSSLTLTGQFVGSPAYAPPEALVRGQCDACGDVFGLAACLYEAAALRWPRADATTGGLLAPVPPLRELAPHISPELAEAIDRGLVIEPDQRPSAAAFADAIAHAATTSGRIAVPPLPAPSPVFGTGTEPGGPSHDRVAYAATQAPMPSPPQMTRSRWAIVAGAIALVICIIAALAVRSNGTSPATSVATPPPDDPPATQPPATQPPATQPPPSQDRPPPAAFNVTAPPLRDRKAAKDWNRVREHLQRRNFGEARKKLGDFERKYGETPETRDLREHLDALPRDQRDERRHKHDDD